MAQWCPRCGAEYVEGWGSCSNCGVPLTREPPEQPADDSGFGPDDAIFTEPRAARHHSDPFVSIWEGSFGEATRLRERLEEASIPCDLDEAMEPGRARLEVPRSYVDEAIGVLDEVGFEALLAPRTPAVNHDPDDLPLAAGEWPTGVRVALWIIAIIVIIGLVLTARL